jgi:hypothetical protein
LGRFVTSERIDRERERSMERKKRRLVGKFGGDRKLDQNLESGLVVLMSKKEQSLMFISMQMGLIQSNQPIAYTIPRHMQAIKQQLIPALFDCVSAYFLTRLAVWAKKGVRHGEETNRGKECATCRCSSPA